MGWHEVLNSEGAAAVIGASAGALGAAAAVGKATIVERSLFFCTTLPAAYFAAVAADEWLGLKPGGIGLVGFLAGQIALPVVQTLVSLARDRVWVRSVIEDKLNVKTEMQESDDDKTNPTT